MNAQSTISSFSSNLKKSAVRAQGQYFVLLKTVLLILLFFICEAVLSVLAFWGSLYVPRDYQVAIQIISLLWFMYLLLKYNGSLGIALVRVSIGEKNVKVIAVQSRKQGLGFFWNALRTGVLLMFGQMFMVCACFLFMSNFILAPFLYVYEGIKGKEAEERSVEIAKGFAWVILGRTVALLFFGYTFFIAAAIILFTKIYVIGIVIMFFGGLYLALVQSNFIRNTYEELIESHNHQEPESFSTKFKLLTFVSILAVLVVYIFIKFVPALLYKITR